MPNHHKPLIVLVHGLGRSRLSMRKLEKVFAAKGHPTLNLGYPGIRGDFGQCLSKLESDLLGYLQDPVHADRPLIAIGHSLGGLLLRALIQRRQEYHWQKLIMLGTPNQGSSVARYLSQHWLWRWLTPKVATEIIPRSPLIQSLAKPNLPTLIIRGTQNRCWFIPVTWFYLGVTQQAAGDGVVTLEEVMLAMESANEATDSVKMIDLPVHHSFMPGDSSVIAKILNSDI